MARLKQDGEFQVEGSVTMWLSLEPEEGERFDVKLSQTIQPLQVWLNVIQENGNWVVGTASVKGRIYRKDGEVGERWAERLFSGPHDDGEFEGPDWLVDLINQEVPKRLGSAGAPLTDQQVYDLNKRLNSNLGLQPTREVLDSVLGATPVRAEPVASDLGGLPGKTVQRVMSARDKERQAFGVHLKVMLMQENLDGTRWAIQKIRDAYTYEDNDEKLAALMELADELESGLDKRTAELAAREN